jgi:hypothetical protein
MSILTLSKYGIIGLITFFVSALAIGANLLAPENVYIKAKLSCQSGAPTVCMDCRVQCDNTGTFLCKVIVPLSSGGNVTVNGYRVGCVELLRDSHEFPQTCDPVETPCAVVTN